MYGTISFNGYVIAFDSEEGARFTRSVMSDGCLPGIWGDGAFYSGWRVGTIIKYP